MDRLQLLEGYLLPSGNSPFFNLFICLCYLSIYLWNCYQTHLEELQESSSMSLNFFLYFFLQSSHKDVLIDLQREEKGGREGEKHQCERETSIGCLLYGPQLWTKPATQTCALMGNRTVDLLVYGMMSQPTKPHRPGLSLNFLSATFSLFVSSCSSLCLVFQISDLPSRPVYSAGPSLYCILWSNSSSFNFQAFQSILAYGCHVLLYLCKRHLLGGLVLALLTLVLGRNGPMRFWKARA